MKSLSSGLAFFFVLFTLQSSQARQVLVRVGWVNQQKTEVYLSEAPADIHVTQGQIVVVLRQKLISGTPTDTNHAIYSSMTGTALPSFIQLSMFHGKSPTSTSVTFAGIVGITEVQSTENDPYHINVTVSMNKAEVISTSEGHKTYQITVKSGTFMEAKEILHVGKVDVAAGEKYEMQSSNGMKRTVQVINVTPLYLEKEDQDPLYTLITIADI